MTLPELSIKRPVFATVLSLALVLVGLVSYQRLTRTRISGNRSARRDRADDVSGRERCDRRDPGHPGARGTRCRASRASTSSPRSAGRNRARSPSRFKLDRNPDYAAADVRDRVGRVRGRLPEEIDEPIIQKVEADAQPILYLAFSSDRALRARDHRLCRPLREGSAADPSRGRRGPPVRRARIFHAHLARSRAACRLPADAARRRSGARRQNVEVPSGRIESQQREFTVLAETDLRTPAQFNDLIIKEANGYLVRLADVGHAELGRAGRAPRRPLQRQTGHRARRRQAGDRQPAGGLAGGASKVLPEHQPRRCLTACRSRSPTTSRCSSPSRSRTSIETIGEAIVLVVFIIFLFLRSIRATLIPLVTIPVSLIGAFALMYALRLLHQHADPARPGAGDRARGRRRHRHAGEHLPPRRGGHAAR